MRKFFFVGRNAANKSGMSSKIWKIERSGAVVRVWYGRAEVDGQRHRIERLGTLVSKSWRYSSAEKAEAALQRRIAEKIRGGYERTPRRRK